MLLHGGASMYLSCYPTSPPSCGLQREVRSWIKINFKQVEMNKFVVLIKVLEA